MVDLGRCAHSLPGRRTQSAFGHARLDLVILYVRRWSTANHGNTSGSIYTEISKPSLTRRQQSKGASALHCLGTRCTSNLSPLLIAAPFTAIGPRPAITRSPLAHAIRRTVYEGIGSRSLREANLASCRQSRLGELRRLGPRDHVAGITLRPSAPLKRPATMAPAGAPQTSNCTAHELVTKAIVPALRP
jgi:hypothetical protein